MAKTYTFASTASEIASDLQAEISGKVVLVTGVTPGGLGAHFAETIAKFEPALLILAGRSPSKLQQAADRITESSSKVQVRQLKLDLGSFAAVRQGATDLNEMEDVPKIDVLVNNAGIMGVDFGRTVDDCELQFATNHLGPFLFTNLIMAKLLASKAPRVVSVSSDGHRLHPIRWADYNFTTETYNKWHAYGQSKTANMLFTVGLAAKLAHKDLLALSLHPGVIFGTGLSTHVDESDFATLNAADKALGNAEGWADFKTKTLDQGAATYVYAAFEPTLSKHNGAYLLDSRLADPYSDTLKPWATSNIEAEKLWQLSEKLVGQKFEY